MLAVPLSAVDYHRRRPTARQLEEVFWLEEERVVSADWVVSYKTRLLQLERQSRHYAPARSKVTVRENQQGELAVIYRVRPLRFRQITVRPAPAAAMGGGRVSGAALTPASLETAHQTANCGAVHSICITSIKGKFLMCYDTRSDFTCKIVSSIAF